MSENSGFERPETHEEMLQEIYDLKSKIIYCFNHNLNYNFTTVQEKNDRNRTWVDISNRFELNIFYDFKIVDKVKKLKISIFKDLEDISNLMWSIKNLINEEPLNFHFKENGSYQYLDKGSIEDFYFATKLILEEILQILEYKK